MGFYSRLTPFQQGLVSVLMIAVPYFIAMVGIYVYFGLIASGSERCESLCCYHRMKLIESRMNSTQAPDFIKFTGHPEDYDFENDTESTEKRINSKVPTKEEALQWKGHVLKSSLIFEDNDGSERKCPAALLNTSWVVTSKNCEEKGGGGTTEFALGPITKKIKITGERTTFDVKGMTLYETDGPDPEDSGAIGPIPEFFIRFYKVNNPGTELTKNQAKLNNSIKCTKNAEHKGLSCIVVTGEKTQLEQLNDVAHDIMVGSEGQLIGIYEAGYCELTFCEVYYADTTDQKESINEKISRSQ